MREILEQAIKQHDSLVTELESTKRQLTDYKIENETLLSEVAIAAQKIQELEANSKHVQNVMASRVVTAAVDIVEEFSHRALNEVRTKAEAKLADLFKPGPNPKPVNQPVENIDQRLEEFKESAVQLPLNRDHPDYYAPKKKSFKERKEEQQNGTALPTFLTNPMRRGEWKEPDSFIKRIIFAFIGG